MFSLRRRSGWPAPASRWSAGSTSRYRSRLRCGWPFAPRAPTGCRGVACFARCSRDSSPHRATSCCRRARCPSFRGSMKWIGHNRFHRHRSRKAIMAGIYDLTVNGIGGKPVPLERYRGKVLLIVNTASECGFTPQYKGLEALYKKLHGKGLEILGFPCNQFGAQEPGSADEIASFCEVNYGVTFPLFAKVDVNGS